MSSTIAPSASTISGSAGSSEGTRAHFVTVAAAPPPSSAAFFGATAA